MSTAILRITKLKSLGGVAGSASHIQRGRLTLNADPQRIAMNEYLVGKPDDNVPALVMEKIGKQKVRKNAVWAVEMLISASPEFFALHPSSGDGVWNEPLVNSWRDATFGWLDAGYNENMVSCVLHKDELTPHIHVIIVPLTGENKKLNCREIFGGLKWTLAKLQTSYHKAVAHLGLKRGIEGSGATHEEMKKIYGWLQEPLRELQKMAMEPPKPVRPEPVKGGLAAMLGRDKKLDYEEDLRAWQEENRYRQVYYEALERHHNEQMEIVMPYLARAGKVSVLAEQNAKLKVHNSRITKQLQALEPQSVKPITLAEVLLEMYGAKEVETSIKSGKVRRFILGTREIEVSGNDWHDALRSKKGAGAVELVAHLEGFPPGREMDAIPLLAARFGKERVVADVCASYLKQAENAVEKSLADPCRLPEKIVDKLPAVREFLVKTCKIPPDVADNAIDLNQIYMDGLDNLVFPRGTGGFTRQSIKMRVGKSVRRDEVLKDPPPYVIEGDEQELVLADNELEAWALKTRFPQSKIVAINGCSAKGMLQYLHAAKTIVVTFDLEKSINIDKDWNIFLNKNGSFGHALIFKLPSEVLEGSKSWLSLLGAKKPGVASSSDEALPTNEVTSHNRAPKGPGM